MVYQVPALTPLSSEMDKNVNRNIEEEPQAEVLANPWHQEEDERWHR